MAANGFACSMDELVAASGGCEAVRSSRKPSSVIGLAGRSLE